MVSLETINVGQAPNDKKGDPLRNAMQKVNLNFSALNGAIQGVLDGKGQANGYASLGPDGRLPSGQTPTRNGSPSPRKLSRSPVERNILCFRSQL